MEKKKFVRIPVNDKKLFIVPDKVIAISEKPREKASLWEDLEGKNVIFIFMEHDAMPLKIVTDHTAEELIKLLGMEIIEDGT